MAQQSLPHVINEEFLTCKICLSTFSQPKSLSCLHTFCLNCLQQHVLQNDLGRELPCPLCRQVTSLGEGGLQQLRDNFFVASLQDAVQAQQTGELSPRRHQCDSCLARGDRRPAERRCLNCREHLCRECVTAHQRLSLTKRHMMIAYKGSRRHTPRYPAGGAAGGEVDEGTDEEELEGEASDSVLGLACCNQHPGEEAKLYCCDCSAPICIPCKLMVHSAHSCCDVDTALDVERASLERLGQHLSIRLEEYIKVRAEWTNYSHDLEEQEKNLLKRAQTRRDELLRAIDDWHRIVEKKTTDTFWQEKHFASSKAGAVQKQLDTYSAVLNQLPTILEAAGGGRSQLLGLTAQLKDELKLNILAEDDLASLAISTKMVASDLLSSNVVGSSEGYSPQQGTILNAIELLGNIQITYEKVPQNTFRSTKQVSLTTQFATRPSPLHQCRFDASSMKLNFREHLIITDRQMERVSLFDCRGKYRGQISTTLMGRPLSSVQLPSGDVVVIREKPSFCVFSPHGRNKRIVKDCALSRPCCATLSSDGNFYVLDSDQKLAIKFCGSTFERIDEVRTPYAKGSRWDKLVVRPNGSLCVCVHKESCIHEFSSKGDRVSTYGRHGSAEPGELNWPRGVSLDQHGNLVVADTGNNRVQLVSPRGTWVYLQMAPGATIQGSPSLKCPTDVAVTSSGSICVLEGSGTVKVFQYAPF